MHDDPPDLITIKEAAEYLRASHSWVTHNWKKLGGVKVANKVLFTREGLYDRFFGNNQEKRKTEKKYTGTISDTRESDTKVRITKQKQRRGKRRTKRGRS